MKAYVVMVDGHPDAVYYHKFSAQVSAQWLEDYTDHVPSVVECEVIDD